VDVWHDVKEAVEVEVVVSGYVEVQQRDQAQMQKPHPQQAVLILYRLK
jgi:hypothetical protein